MNGGLTKVAGHGAIAALASLLLSTGTAQSADLGGNCCADLEERVAELEATTVRKGNRRVSLTVSGHVNRSLMYWNDGFQEDLYSVDNAIANSRFRFTGNAKLTADVKAGFHMEFDMAFGARSHQASQVDDDGFAGSGGILGGVFGDGIGAAGDSVLAFNQAYWYVDSTNWGRLSLGRLNTATAGIGTIDLSNTGVIANSQPFAWGAGMILRNGAGKLAAVGVPPGTTITPSVTANWGQLCGGPTTATGASTPGVFGGAGPYAVNCGLHSLSRVDGIMYTSPTWYGFTFGGTFGEDDFYDLAGRYAGEWYGFRIAAGLGYRWFGDREPDVPIPGTPFVPFDRLSDTDRRQWLTSASIMHVATGLFVGGTFMQYEYRGTSANEIFALDPTRNRPDTDLWWADIGIQKNWTGWGATTFYAEYGQVFDGVTGLTAFGTPTAPLGTSGFTPLGAQGVVVDSDYSWWGAGMVQTIDAAAMDVYLGFRVYSADARMGDFTLPDGTPVGAQQIDGGLEDIWFIQGGARIQF
jgi:hypothetical protein